MTYNELLNQVLDNLCRRTQDGSLQWYDVSKIGCLSAFETDDDGHSWFLQKTGGGEYCQLFFDDEPLTRITEVQRLYEIVDKQVRLREVQRGMNLHHEALNVSAGGDARPHNTGGDHD